MSHQMKIAVAIFIFGIFLLSVPIRQWFSGLLRKENGRREAVTRAPKFLPGDIVSFRLGLEDSPTSEVIAVIRYVKFSHNGEFTYCIDGWGDDFQEWDLGRVSGVDDASGRREAVISCKCPKCGTKMMPIGAPGEWHCTSNMCGWSGFEDGPNLPQQSPRAQLPTAFELSALMALNELTRLSADGRLSKSPPLESRFETAWNELQSARAFIELKRRQIRD